MAKFMRRIKFLLLPTAILVCSVWFAQPVQAAEITLDSSSYGYGSTSEFSLSAPITVPANASTIQTTTSSSQSTLAPTGQSVLPIYLVAFSLIAGSVLSFGYVYYRNRQTTSVQ